jgi:hypothetical protein
MRIRIPAMSATIGCKCAMLTVMIHSPFLGGNAIENGDKAGQFHFMTSQKRCEVLWARGPQLSLDL